MFRHYSILVLWGLTIICSCNKKSSETGNPQVPSNMRVLGYLYSNDQWSSALTTDFGQLTDLNLAFVNPDTNGEFSINSISNLITNAHQKNVRVYASLGGAEPPAYIKDILNNDMKRASMVFSLVALTEQNNFDGVDVDLEGDFIDANYAGFITELHAALKAKNKLITAALATWNAHIIHDSTLALYDYINVMSYDLTGPWDPSNPGPHSPYEMAVNDANYFINRGIDPKKILIGVPFYGHGFGTNAPADITYKDIVALYPGAENKDIVEVNGGGKIYYNGIPTIKRKVELARSLGAGGVMIWEISQDTHDAKSLLKAINDNK